MWTTCYCCVLSYGYGERSCYQQVHDAELIRAVLFDEAYSENVISTDDMTQNKHAWYGSKAHEDVMKQLLTRNVSRNLSVLVVLPRSDCAMSAGTDLGLEFMVAPRL